MIGSCQRLDNYSKNLAKMNFRCNFDFSRKNTSVRLSDKLPTLMKSIINLKNTPPIGVGTLNASSLLLSPRSNPPTPLRNCRFVAVSSSFSFLVCVLIELPCVPLLSCCCCCCCCCRRALFTPMTTKHTTNPSKPKKSQWVPVGRKLFVVVDEP